MATDAQWGPSHGLDDLLAEVARIWAGGPLVAPPALFDEDLEPFRDWSSRGDGFYAGDRLECASRRVDLRGPTDLDPGPLPMVEAPDDIEGTHLLFSAR